MSSAGQGKVQVRELAPSAGYHCNPIDITVYGCPGDRPRRPLRALRHKRHDRGGAEGGRHPSLPNGTIRFRSNVHLYSCVDGEFVIFGPLPAKESLQAGGKYPVPLPSGIRYRRPLGKSSLSV